MYVLATAAEHGSPLATPLLATAGVLGAVVLLAGAYLVTQGSLRVRRGPAPYVVSLVGIVGGLVVVLVGESVGAGERVVIAGGAVAVVGVAVLTANVGLLPDPDPDPDGTGEGHE